MATVRIYKVAELLGTTSQEVVALLKRDHGIEVKSASSTIEEVVARQFVERIARQRNLALPAGDMFAEKPAHRGRKGGLVRKAEPPRPVSQLPPPRLVKTAKSQAAKAAEPPPAPPEAETPVAAAPEEPAAPAATRLEVREAEPVAVAPAEQVEAPPEVPSEHEAVRELEPPVAVPEAVVAPAEPQPVEQPQEALVEPPPAEQAPAVAAEAATVATAATASAAAETEESAPSAPEEQQPGAEPSAPAVPPRAPFMPPPGRVIPPQLRLRVEETPPAPRPPLKPRVSVPAQKPAERKPAAAPRPASPERPAIPAAARPAATEAPGPAARPSRVVRPPVQPPVPRREPPVVQRPPSAVRPPAGGPRPLPSQPVRAPQAPPRPPAPAYRPSPPRTGRGPRKGAGLDTRVPAAAVAAPPPITRTITLAEGMTVKDLADKLDVRAKDVLKKLLERRIMVTINTTLDSETAIAVARDFGADVQMRSFEEELLQTDAEEVRPEDLQSRAPVVTVMGHVDHGKTTLLDAIRQTHVAEREAGGITQHIGAYNVKVNNRSVVFLDTPGHEAFTMMRARGARVTDIVVLVVAADDGVMPQTREAIDHAKAAGVPILVAINKIDKPDANSERVKRELSELGLVPEEWGGQTVMVEVSAKKRQNLDLLLEMVLLVTDIGELKANPKRSSIGTVLEAKLDKGRGPVATVLVQDGTLRVGDGVIAGSVVGKVRALIDDRGRHVKSAGPSTPVEVLGLSALPQPGDAFQTITDAAKARQVALFRQAQAKEKTAGARTSRITLESLQQQIAAGETKELPIIIKADVQGSAEVLSETLTKLSDEKVKIRIIHAGVGAITESDVLLASASNAIIIGFDVRPDRNAAEVAERERVDVRLHTVIYNVIDEMKKAVAGLLEPTLKEHRMGIAEVRNIFKVPKFGTVAGCMVTEGRIARSGDAQARLLRDNTVVFEGRIASLKRFKDDVSEVKAGFECGIGLERFNDVKVGDVIEVFTIERIAQSA